MAMAICDFSFVLEGWFLICSFSLNFSYNQQNIKQILGQVIVIKLGYDHVYIVSAFIDFYSVLGY